MGYTVKVKTFNKQQVDVPIEDTTDVYTVSSLQEKIAVSISIATYSHDTPHSAKLLSTTTYHIVLGIVGYCSRQTNSII